MIATAHKHHAPVCGALGYEISTEFDGGYERGRAQVRVQSLADGKVLLDVEQSKWTVHGDGKTGRTNTRTASVRLNREQIRNLIDVLTDELAKGDS